MLYKIAKKSYIRAFLLVTLLNLVFFISLHCLNILPAYLETLGVSKSMTGLFMNFKSLALVIYVIFFSRYLKNVKRKKIMYISYLIYIISLTGMTIFHQSVPFLFLFMTLSSVYFVIGFTMDMAIIHDIVPEQRRVGILALFGISGLLANPVSAFISEYFYYNLPRRFLFMPSIFFTLIAFFILHTMPRKDTGQKIESKNRTSFIDIFKRLDMLPLMISGFIFGGTFGTFITFIPALTFNTLGTVNISLFSSGFAFSAITMRITTANYLDKIPKKSLIITGMLAMFVASFLAFTLSVMWMMFVIGMLYGIGHGLLFPTLSSTYVNCGLVDEKQDYSDAFLCIHAAGMIFISSFAGIIGDFYGVKSIFLALVLCLFFTSAYISVSLKNKY